MLNSNTSKKIFLFLERREVREKEGERNINVWLSLMGPPLGTWSTTQACALTGIELGTLWFPAHTQSAELHQPGQKIFFFNLLIFGERNTNLLFHLFLHSLFDSCMCPEWGSNPQPLDIVYLSLL